MVVILNILGRWGEFSLNLSAVDADKLEAVVF